MKSQKSFVLFFSALFLTFSLTIHAAEAPRADSSKVFNTISSGLKTLFMSGQGSSITIAGDIGLPVAGFNRGLEVAWFGDNFHFYCGDELSLRTQTSAEVEAQVTGSRWRGCDAKGELHAGGQINISGSLDASAIYANAGINASISYGLNMDNFHNAQIELATSPKKMVNFLKGAASMSVCLGNNSIFAKIMKQTLIAKLAHLDKMQQLLIKQGLITTGFPPTLAILVKELKDTNIIPNTVSNNISEVIAALQKNLKKADKKLNSTLGCPTKGIEEVLAKQALRQGKRLSQITSSGTSLQKAVIDTLMPSKTDLTDTLNELQREIPASKLANYQQFFDSMHGIFSEGFTGCDGLSLGVGVGAGLSTPVAEGSLSLGIAHSHKIMSVPNPLSYLGTQAFDPKNLESLATDPIAHIEGLGTKLKNGKQFILNESQEFRDRASVQFAKLSGEAKKAGCYIIDGLLFCGKTALEAARRANFNPLRIQRTTAEVLNENPQELMIQAAQMQELGQQVQGAKEHVEKGFKKTTELVSKKMDELSKSVQEALIQCNAGNLKALTIDPMQKYLTAQSDNIKKLLSERQTARNTDH